MSEDGFSDYFEEPNMEIQIETLMGTSFDMRVSSKDTVRAIKQRIQRVEGIPIHQQSLIFQSKELKDSCRLCDAGIRNKSTIKLVLSMRGGPISTRRMSAACEHHMMFKELKELLENTRDEIGDKLAPGSKVSVLVFKEGDIINLLRVIENDDGSYSPYSEKPISPPSKSTKKDSQMAMFEKLIEDNDMMTKISSLRKKMEDVSIKRQNRNNKTDDYKTDENIEEKLFGETSKSSEKSKISYKLLTECNTDVLDNIDLEIFEKSLEEEIHSETEEIALKDKHRNRTKPMRIPKAKTPTTKSLYSETKGAYSHTKQTYARMHKKNKELKNNDLNNRERKTNDELYYNPLLSSPITTTEELLNTTFLSPISRQNHQSEIRQKAVTPTLTELGILEDDNKEDIRVPFGEPLTVSARNRVHLTTLVLSESSSDRPKSTPDSLELEENAQDLFEIHESTSDRLKHSATCKVGLLKRRQSVDFGYEGLENPSKVKQELGEYNFGNSSSSDFEVCSSNFYHMPQFVSSPSAIPPQYAPKDDNFCDYYFRNNSRSPLYGRKGKNDQPDSLFRKNNEEFNSTLPSLPKLPEINKTADKYNFLSDCSSIQRLKNDCSETTKTLSDSLFSGNDESLDELYGYYNLGCATEFLEERIEDLNLKVEKKQLELPPVIKKKARCSQCNKRLNITNIYNCRCGKIFCSQHRYSEVHHCSYDYKTEGRKILEQQNPLVTAEKLHRI